MPYGFSGAVGCDSATGKYRVDFDKIPKAIESLSQTILTFQGHGNYDEYKMLAAIMGGMGSQLRSDLDGLREDGIPVDIVFKQGVSELK